MKYLGLDIGSLFTKAVLIEEGELLASAGIATTGNMADEADALIEGVLSEIGVTRADLEGIGLTGRGSDMVEIEDIRKDEISCIGRAVNYLLPEVNLVLDIGGQSITSILIDEEGGIIDFLRNDKCASGSGKFIQVLGGDLGVSIQELDEVVSRSTKKVSISSQCGVFVESEMITHKNEGEEVADILAGICDSGAKIITSAHFY